jgi:hypothetical protein
MLKARTGLVDGMHKLFKIIKILLKLYIMLKITGGFFCSWQHRKTLFHLTFHKDNGVVFGARRVGLLTEKFPEIKLNHWQLLQYTHPTFFANIPLNLFII